MKHPAPGIALLPTQWPGDPAADARVRMPRTLRCATWGRAARAALVAAAWLAGTVHAAGLVRYEITDPESGQRGQMSVEWLNLQQARIDVTAPDMPKDMQAYQLMRDGKLYAVTIQQGQPLVLEMTQMLRMAGQMATSLQPDTGNDVHELEDLRATGRQETVAGVRGEVYELVFRDGQGRARREEIVLSTDATVYEMTQVMNAYARLMGEAAGAPRAAGRDQFETRLRDQRVGLLRMGAELRAVEVGRDAPPAARMALPAEPMALPGLAGLAGMVRAAQHGQAGAAAGDDAKGAEGAAEREARRQAERQQQRLGEQVREEADRAADRAVDRTLNRLRDRLLNR